MVEKSYKRDVAYKVSVKDLISGTFVRSEGMESDYISINDKKISRVNIFGTIIDKNKNERVINFNVDDGGASIICTFFDNLDYYDSNFSVGDVILLVGRINDFNGIKINGEIIKKVNAEWIELRKKELGLQDFNNYQNKTESKNSNNYVLKEKNEENLYSFEEKTQEFDLTQKNPSKSPHQQIWETIHENDDGRGVNFELIKEKNNKLSDEKIEEICNNLLKEGEIYEIRPGFYKILE